MPVKKPRFKLLSAADIDALPDPEWLIDGVMIKNTLCQMYGPSGEFKSFVAFDQALSVATGKPWLGKYEVAQSKVVYVAGEGGLGYKQRQRAWLKHNKLSIPDLSNFTLLNEPLPLGSEEDVETFIWTVEEYFKQRDIGLLVLDTQARCTVGVEENSNKEMGVIIHSLDTLSKEFEANIHLIHHTGVKDPWSRGASAVKGAMQAQFKVSKVSGKPYTGTYHCQKQKDAEDGWEIMFQMRKITGIGAHDSLVMIPMSKNSPEFRQIAEEGMSKKRKQMLEALRTFNKEWVSSKEWFLKTGIANSTFWDAIPVLVDSGLIEENPEKTKFFRDLRSSGLSGLAISGNPASLPSGRPVP